MKGRRKATAPKPATDEARRFERLTKLLVNVPKEEVDEQARQYERAKRKRRA